MKNEKNTEKKYYTLPRISQMNSGDDSVRIDLGKIHTMEQVNYTMDNAIEKRQKEKSRER